MSFRVSFFMLLCGLKEVSRVGERKDNPISVRSKRRITNALLELMEITPFSKISIKDIVDRAGLTRQTFYHNFETKEDVLYNRLDEHFEGFLEYLSKKTVRDWEDVICCFFRYWQEHADFMDLLMKNDQVYLLSRKLPDYYQAVKDLYFNKTDLTDAEARLWFAFVSGALVNMLISWMSSTGGISARALAKLVIAMMDGTVLEKSRVDMGNDVAMFIGRLQTES